MSGFTDIFIRRPVLSLVVSLLILVVGLRALFELPIRQFPKLSNTVITITTIYPGATPELMQGFITTPIEQSIASTEGLEYMTSSSTQGSSVIQVYIRLNFDAAKAMTDVMAKVNEVKYLIPREANDPIIQKTTGQTTALMYMGFASKTLDAAAINDHLVRVVQPLLATVDGVGKAEILGGQNLAMRLWLDPIKMAARGITATDVSAAILANNYQSAPGQTKGYFTITNVSADTGLRSVDQFRDMVVKAQNGSLIRLRDIGEVDLGPQASSSSVWMNGDNAVFIGIQPTPTGNPLTIVKGVREIMPQIERGLPAGVNAKIQYDATEFIQASISEVERTLAEAIGIVIVVIFLFLGSLRAVLIPVVTIPLSLIGAAIMMLALGFSLNLLTLLAFVLAIGLVVDDAIVVVENVYRHIEEGKTPVQASLIGAREIIGPVIAMTITLAAVYAPIGLLGGVTGALFREFAFTLAGAVVFSGIIALTLSPMMCSILLSHDSANGRFARLIDRSFKALTRWYGRRLSGALAYRPVTLLFAVGVLASLPFLYAKSPKELAPEEDQGVLFGVMKAPQYANLDYVNAYTVELDRAMSSFPESDGRFILNGAPSLNQGFAGVILKPWDQRTRAAHEIQPEFQGKVGAIDGVNVFVFALPALPGGTDGLPVSMVISGPADYQTLFGYMEKIKDEARKSGKFIVVDSDLTFDNPQIRLHIDRSKANDLGIRMDTIGNTLALMVGENYVNRFDLAGRSYQVIPQVPRSERLSAEKLTQYYVATSGGQMVPLSTVVSISSDVQPSSLSKFNQLNSATFQAVPMPFVTMGEVVTLLKVTAAKVLPTGFNYDFLADSRQYVKEGNQLASTFIFALVVIFLVLAAQFESLRDPLVILVSVPMSICGALLPLFVGVTTLNIYTQIGLVTLIGLISKHGILMVEFARELQINEGYDRKQSILLAAETRLRPILMTTGAMVVGLVPLLLASGAGAASRFSIGLVIVTGMTIGTLFTLFVLPAVYTILATDHRGERTTLRAREIAEVS